MLRRIVLSLLLMPAMAGLVMAQYPVSIAPQTMGQRYTPNDPPTGEDSPYYGPFFTVSAEYLLWYVKPIHLPTPIVGTTRDPNTDLGAAGVSTIGVGDPQFVNFFGPGDRDRGPMSGIRLAVTKALPIRFDREVYTELVGIWLPHQGERRTLASNTEGNPAVLLPFRNNQDIPGILRGGEHSLVVAGNINGATVAGQASVYTGTQLWGAEWNVCGPLFESCNIGLEGIVGARYMGLYDRVELNTFSNLNGGFSTRDRFSATNHFGGGQAGFRLIFASDRWALASTNKIGFGVTGANLNVEGSTQVPVAFQLPGRTGPLTGGLYTTRSNMGDLDTSHFGMLLDLNMACRYAVTPAIGVTVGYNFLYWTGLLRAGDQISRVVNPITNTALNFAESTQTLPGEPVVPKNLTDIWAHGVNLGLDIRF